MSPATRHHFDAQDAVSLNVCPRKSVPASQSRCGLRNRDSTSVNVCIFPSATESQ